MSGVIHLLLLSRLHNANRTTLRKVNRMGRGWDWIRVAQNRGLWVGFCAYGDKNSGHTKSGQNS